MTLQESAVEYVARGWQLVPLDGEKRPIRAKWNECTKVVRSVEEAAALKCQGVGLAHAFSGTCAIDVDDPDAARAW